MHLILLPFALGLALAAQPAPAEEEEPEGVTWQAQIYSIFPTGPKLQSASLIFDSAANRRQRLRSDAAIRDLETGLGEFPH